LIGCAKAKISLMVLVPSESEAAGLRCGEECRMPPPIFTDNHGQRDKYWPPLRNRPIVQIAIGEQATC
jgi:hypothetical protein